MPKHAAAINPHKWLAIRNWRKFQHYKHRNPPWVKIQRAIFDSADWVDATDHDKLVMVSAIVLAARYGGKVPKSPQIFKNLTHIRRKPNFRRLINMGFFQILQAPASTMLATETEEEEALPGRVGRRSKKEDYTQTGPTPLRVIAGGGE